MAGTQPRLSFQLLGGRFEMRGLAPAPFLIFGVLILGFPPACRLVQFPKNPNGVKIALTGRRLPKSRPPKKGAAGGGTGRSAWGMEGTYLELSLSRRGSEAPVLLLRSQAAEKHTGSRS